MYKVRDRIKYKCPMKLENEGTIIAKFKVLDVIYNFYWSYISFSFVLF